MCEQCRDREERDRKMWRVISRLLKGIAHAIDERYPGTRDTSRRA